MKKKIIVQAAADMDRLENRGCDVDQDCETIAEAKKQAQEYLTERFRLDNEMADRFGYSRVLVNGEIVAEYYGE